MTLSNADALLVAVPMIGTLVVVYFRVDELVGKPRGNKRLRRQLTGMDASGRVTGLDPDSRTARPQEVRSEDQPRRPRPVAERH